MLPRGDLDWFDSRPLELDYYSVSSANVRYVSFTRLIIVKDDLLPIEWKAIFPSSMPHRFIFPPSITMAQ